MLERERWSSLILGKPLVLSRTASLNRQILISVLTLHGGSCMTVGQYLSFLYLSIHIELLDLSQMITEGPFRF